MKASIANILADTKISLLIGIVMSIVAISMTSYFNDIAVSLYILIFLVIFTAISILIILSPFWGLILLIVYMPFSFMFEIPVIGSGGRLIFVIVTIGWFLKYFLRGKSVFFDVVKHNKIVICFILSMCISSAIASMPMPSIKYSIIITSYILMFFFIQDLISDEKKLRILVIAIALSVGIASMYGLIQYNVLGNAGSEFGQTYQTSGVQRLGGFYNPNGYGRILMSGIPFMLFISLYSRNLILKSLFTLLFIASFFSLGLTISRTHLFAFVVFIITYPILAFKHKIITKKTFSLFFSITVILLLLLSHILIGNIFERASEEDIYESKRYYLLLKSADIFLEHPLFGIGFGNFAHVDTPEGIYSWMDDTSGHEIVSSVFVSIGAVGSIILVIIFYRIIKYLNRAAKTFSLQENSNLLALIIVIQAGYISTLASSIGDSVINDRPFWMYFALSFLVYRWSENERRTGS